MTMETSIHKFERAGLGKAPFRYIGMFEKVYQACHGAPIQPGSSCDYCGAGIRYVFQVRSADGKTFKVGCDCIHKVGDAGLRRVIARDEAKIRKANADVLFGRKLMAAVDALGNPTLLTDQPHPYARPGETARDCVIWLLKNAGVAGRTRACKAIIKSAAI